MRKSFLNPKQKPKKRVTLVNDLEPDENEDDRITKLIACSPVNDIIAVVYIDQKVFNESISFYYQEKLVQTISYSRPMPESIIFPSTLQIQFSCKGVLAILTHNYIHTPTIMFCSPCNAKWVKGEGTVLEREDAVQVSPPFYLSNELNPDDWREFLISGISWDKSGTRLYFSASSRTQSYIGYIIAPDTGAPVQSDLIKIKQYTSADYGQVRNICCTGGANLGFKGEEDAVPGEKLYKYMDRTMEHWTVVAAASGGGDDAEALHQRALQLSKEMWQRAQVGIIVITARLIFFVEDLNGLKGSDDRLVDNIWELTNQRWFEGVDIGGIYTLGCSIAWNPIKKCVAVATDTDVFIWTLPFSVVDVSSGVICKRESESEGDGSPIGGVRKEFFVIINDQKPDDPPDDIPEQFSAVHSQHSLFHRNQVAWSSDGSTLATMCRELNDVILLDQKDLVQYEVLCRASPEMEEEDAECKFKKLTLYSGLDLDSQSRYNNHYIASFAFDPTSVDTFTTIYTCRNPKKHFFEKWVIGKVPTWRYASFKLLII